MSYDLEQAHTALADLIAGEYTKDDLLELVKQVDIEAEGNVTVLYSGKIGGAGGVSASKIAAEMVSGLLVRYNFILFY